MLIEEDAGGGERHRRRYTWNAADSLLAFEDAEGHVRSWRYDGMGRRIATEDPDGGSWRYRFDDESNEVTRIDPLGGTLTRAHDGGGRILWETHRTPWALSAAWPPITTTKLGAAPRLSETSWVGSGGWRTRPG